LGRTARGLVLPSEVKMDAQDEVAVLKRFHRLARTGRLSELREGVGLSQSDVARYLAVTPSAVSRWEAALTHPRPNRAAKLLELLDADA
jgi:DNA-binding transcriptional regulator YiaG